MNKSKNRHNKYNTLLSSLVSLLLIFIVFELNKYGDLSNKLFIIINLLVLIINLTILISTRKVNASKSRKVSTIFSVFMTVALLSTGYLYYVINVIDNNVKQITTESDKLDYYASFVVYDSSIDSFNTTNPKTIDDLDKETIGLIESEEFIEGNVLPKDELSKLKKEDNRIKYYSSYTQLINGLVNDEVDVISLPREFKALYKDNEEISPYLDDMNVIHNFSGKYKNVSKIGGSDIDVTKVPFTVLLMGNDGDRTDSLMLASFNPSAMQVTLTSIARDSYVPIACYPGQARDKINHARVINRECTIKTVENLLDISIDFFLEINFKGLVDVVDALGTVTIDSPASFSGNIETPEGGGVFIPEGVSELDGNQALAFSRERNSFVSGDFQRQQNQQQLIKSILSKVIETRDPNKLVNLVKATGRNVETNISLSQLIDLMNYGIAKMESTYLNNPEVITIYGSRITGRGVLIYTADYDKDIYYYVLYNGSIKDAKDFIAMNTRADGILEIPKGFNYKITDQYNPPIFGQEEYYEAIDGDIELNPAQPEPEPKPEPEPEPEVEKEPIEDYIAISDFSGRTLSDLRIEAETKGLLIEIVSSETALTAQENLDKKIFVTDNNAGIKYKKGDVIKVSIVEYSYSPNPEEPEEPEEKEPNTDETEAKP